MPDSSCDLRIQAHLTELKLPTVRKNYAKVAKELSLDAADCKSFLEALLEAEVQERRSRRIQRRLKEAQFPQQKLLEELDAKSLPDGVTFAALQELATGRYIDEAENIIAVGNSGTGKSHVAAALGVAACRQGRRVRAYTAIELASELEAAQEEHQLHRFLARFAKLDLVIVDELGYLPVSKNGAELLFQAFSTRHERKSMIVTSNLAFAEWGQVFQTEKLAIAMLDRVTHRAHILEMNGESYRLKSAKRKQEQNEGPATKARTKKKRA